MLRAHSLLLLALSSFIVEPVWAEDIVLDFESATVGKPVSNWTEKSVVFDLAHGPKKNKAKGRVMFFPHLGTDRKGILNAMAEEAIPLRVTFDKPIDRATLTLWGSTTSATIVDAFDAEGKLVDKDELDRVPGRKSPEDLIPFFQLTVESSKIATIQVSGSTPGGFVAVDEIRFRYSDAP